MTNPIQAAIAALICHIKAHTSRTPEQVTEEITLRERLQKMDKKHLIEEIVSFRIGKMKDVNQGDLVCDILRDPVCAILTYEDISENIKANLETDQKFSVDNLRWYKSEYQNRKGIEGILNRMPAKERNAAISKFLMNAK